MFKKMVAISLLGLILFATPSLAWGGRGNMKGPGSDTKMMAKHEMALFNKLGLTAEQKVKFLTGQQKMATEMLALRQKNQQLGLAMREELEKDNPNKGSLERLIKEMNNNNAQMQIKRLNYMLDVKQQLTPEQKTKFKEMLTKFKKDKVKK